MASGKWCDDFIILVKCINLGDVLFSDQVGLQPVTAAPYSNDVGISHQHQYTNNKSKYTINIMFVTSATSLIHDGGWKTKVEHNGMNHFKKLMFVYV